MYEWDDILTLPLSCLHSLNVDVRLSNEFRDRNNLAQEMPAYSHGTSARVPKLPTIQQAARAEDKPPTSAQRNNSCTAKPTKVSSGNRFYADIIRRRGGHLCVAKAPPGASEESSRGNSEQVETSTEPSAEDESEDALEEMLVRKHTLRQQGGKTSSEAAETFARIKWREAPVTNTHSRRFSFPCARMEMVAQEDEGDHAGTEIVDKLRRRIEEQQSMLERKFEHESHGQHVQHVMASAPGSRSSSLLTPLQEGETLCVQLVSAGLAKVPSSTTFTRTRSVEMNTEFACSSVSYAVLGDEHRVYTIFTRSRSRTQSLY